MHQLERTYKLSSLDELSIYLALCGRYEPLQEQIESYLRCRDFAYPTLGPYVAAWVKGQRDYYQLMADQLQKVSDLIKVGLSIEEIIHGGYTRFDWSSTRFIGVDSSKRRPKGIDGRGDQRQSEGSIRPDRPKNN